MPSRSRIHSPLHLSARAEILTGMRMGLPILIGYVPLGIAYGVLAVKNGVPAMWAVAMSVLVFAGAGQFIAAGMIGAGASIPAIFLGNLMVNLRHVLMSAALTPYAQPLPPAARALYAAGVTDELFAVQMADFRAGWRLFACNLTAQSGWVAGTALGGISGSLVADVKPYGLDFALPAMFLALLLPLCGDRLQLATALSAALFSLLFTMAGAGRGSIILAAAAALLCAMPFQAAAEDYPSRPITLIMPFGAGNAPDTAARIIGDYLQRKHNITLLITSKPGGSGIPATLETVRARPDGYTISLTSANVLTVVPQYKKCGFTYKDLAPVAQVNVFTMGWGVRADSGIASVQDLMDKAKAERGKYSLASPGAFTAQRFYHANVMKLFPESDLPYVAYNGGAEIVTALLGNHISAGFTPVVNFKPHKDIRVIAVCGAQRDPNYPDAPTFKEMFGDGFVFDSVYGIVAPLKTPKDRIERLQSLIKEALSDPDVQAKFAKAGLTTDYLSAEDFQKALDNMWKTIGDIMRENKFN